jgi:hypothetical protein
MRATQAEAAASNSELNGTRRGGVSTGVGGPYRSDILYIFFAISSRKFKCIAFILHCRSRKLQIYNITNDHYRRPTNFSLLNSQISQFIKIICMLNHK